MNINYSQKNLPIFYIFYIFDINDMTIGVICTFIIDDIENSFI